MGCTSVLKIPKVPTIEIIPPPKKKTYRMLNSTHCNTPPGILTQLLVSTPIRLILDRLPQLLDQLQQLFIQRALPTHLHIPPQLIDP
jgi:hypothetical protein